MSALKLTLDVPPPVNTYYRNFRGRMVLSPKGREYKLHVAEYLAEHQYRKFYDARLSVSLIFHPASKRKTDLDGRFKAVLDAMENAGLYNSDEQIDSLSILRGKVLKGGKLIVYIEEIRAGDDYKKTISDFGRVGYQDGQDPSGSCRCNRDKQSDGSGHGSKRVTEIIARAKAQKYT